MKGQRDKWWGEGRDQVSLGEVVRAKNCCTKFERASMPVERNENGHSFITSIKIFSNNN